MTSSTLSVRCASMRACHRVPSGAWPHRLPGIVVIALRSGTNADHAVKQLRLTAQDAANVAGGSAGRTPLQVLEQYVAWAENVERMLANVLEVEYLDDLVFTPRYWELRTARGDEARLTPSVLAEIERQQRQLDALAAELEAERQHWADGPATIVVPDTNMFLQEGAPIEGIDWPASVESEVAVRLVVPLVVAHELDRLKRQGNNTVRSSARCALKWLLVLLPREITSLLRRHVRWIQQVCASLLLYALG